MHTHEQTNQFSALIYINKSEFVFFFVYLWVRKISDKGILNGGEYDIDWDYGWDYDIFSLKFVFVLNSKLLVIRTEGPSSSAHEQGLISARISAININS